MRYADLENWNKSRGSVESKVEGDSCVPRKGRLGMSEHPKPRKQVELLQTYEPSPKSYIQRLSKQKRF